MREAARAKAGFYACPLEALSFVLPHLEAPEPTSCLDPCAGEGEALHAIVEALKIDHRDTYAIELDSERGRKVKELIPKAHVLSPASFQNVRIAPKTFGMVYCNPPFDDALGGGRVEAYFLSRSLTLLVDNGVLLMVLPQRTLGMWAIQDLLRQMREVWSFPFPEEHRRFDEMFVIGVVDQSGRPTKDRITVFHKAPPTTPVRIPESQGPGPHFKKEARTVGEIAALMAKSPLKRHFRPVRNQETASPPLALGLGHLAILLSCGVLDGPVRPEGEIPHVVRGSVRKSFETTGEEVDKRKDVVVTTKTISERIRFIVRAVWADGTLKTFE